MTDQHNINQHQYSKQFLSEITDDEQAFIAIKITKKVKSDVKIRAINFNKIVIKTL